MCELKEMACWILCLACVSVVCMAILKFQAVKEDREDKRQQKKATDTSVNKMATCNWRAAWEAERANREALEVKVGILTKQLQNAKDIMAKVKVKDIKQEANDGK